MIFPLSNPLTWTSFQSTFSSSCRCKKSFHGDHKLSSFLHITCLQETIMDVTCCKVAKRILEFCLAHQVMKQGEEILLTCGNIAWGQWPNDVHDSKWKYLLVSIKAVTFQSCKCSSNCNTFLWDAVQGKPWGLTQPGSYHLSPIILLRLLHWELSNHWWLQTMEREKFSYCKSNECSYNSNLSSCG